jgi:plasmid stability protein
MNETIHVRVSSETKRKIEAMADKHGRTVSEYARDILTNESRSKEVMDVLERIAKLLEINTKWSIDAGLALRLFVGIVNDPNKTPEKNLEEAIQAKREDAFWYIINKYMDGISLNYPQPKKD